MNQPPLRVLLLSRLRSEQKMDYYDSLRSFHLAIFRLRNSSNEKPKNLQERKVENSIVKIVISWIIDKSQGRKIQ